MLTEQKTSLSFHILLFCTHHTKVNQSTHRYKQHTHTHTLIYYLASYTSEFFRRTWSCWYHSFLVLSKVLDSNLGLGSDHRWWGFFSVCPLFLLMLCSWLYIKVYLDCSLPHFIPFFIHF